MLSVIEYTASAGQQNFTIPFPYLDRTHIFVYIDDVETVDYSFSGSATIRLDSGADEGEVVKIKRITPRDEPVVDYSNGANLGESDLDAGVLQNLFILQELSEEDGIDPSAGHNLDSHTDGLVGQSTAKGTMRVYNEDSKWAAVDAPATGDILIGDTVVPEGVRFFPVGSDGNVLSVDDSADGKLAWIPGFKNILTALGDLVYASAVGVVSRLALGTAYQVLTARPGQTPPIQWTTQFSTGDGKITWKTVADAGWILINDGTIGPTGSGATTRANDDCEDLYKLVWANIPDAYAPVATGRGASASNDWLAGKLMTLPKALGRALVLAGAGSGLTARALGDVFGSENAVNVTHNHSATDSGHTHLQGVDVGQDGGGLQVATVGVNTESTVTNTQSANTTAVGIASITVSTEGESGTNKNMQPSTFWNVMVKL